MINILFENDIFSDTYLSPTITTCLAPGHPLWLGEAPERHSRSKNVFYSHAVKKMRQTKFANRVRHRLAQKMSFKWHDSENTEQKLADAAQEASRRPACRPIPQPSPILPKQERYYPLNFAGEMSRPRPGQSERHSNPTKCVLFFRKLSGALTPRIGRSMGQRTNPPGSGWRYMLWSKQLTKKTKNVQNQEPLTCVFAGIMRSLTQRKNCDLYYPTCNYIALHDLFLALRSPDEPGSWPLVGIQTRTQWLDERRRTAPSGAWHQMYFSNDRVQRGIIMISGLGVLLSGSVYEQSLIQRSRLVLEYVWTWVAEACYLCFLSFRQNNCFLSFVIIKGSLWTACV